jgi:hypothetical protein
VAHGKPGTLTWVRRGFRVRGLGHVVGMAGVVLIAIGTLIVAILLAALLPGAGFIVAGAVVLLGIGAIVWLFMAAAGKQAPSDLAAGTEDAELLGPGGPDDARR